MKARKLYTLGFVVAGLFVFACAAKKPPPQAPTKEEPIMDAGPDAPEEAEAPKPKALYDRLGGKEGVTALVDTLTKKLQANPKFKAKLAPLKGPKLEKFKQDMVDMICVDAEGTDCKYEGRFMKEVLGAKSKLKEEEWMAVLVDLRTSLEDAKVGDPEVQDLAAVFANHHEDAVVAPKK